MEEGVPPSPQAQHPYEGLVKRLRAAGVGDHDVRLVEQLLLLVAPPATSSESVSTTGGRHTPPSTTAPTTDIVRATPPRAIQMVGHQIEAPPDYEAGALLAATIRGDLPTVQRWLGAGIDPNAAHELLADWSPLHYAAQLGHAEIIAALLDHSAHPRPADRHGETPLMQAGYWGWRAAAELLMERGGGTSDDVPPSMIVEAKAEAEIGDWDAEGHVTILCSAPEFSRPRDDGSKDNVMKALFGLCARHQARVKFGYDWGGSATAEPADKDPKRRVPECCLSLACSCGPDRASAVMVEGPVDWSNPKSVAGSMWFPKYRTKVMGAVQAEAQRGVKFIEMVAVNGGPVSQLERRTMPMIISGAVRDLRAKGVSISLLGDAEETEIKLFLRTMDYEDFVGRFYGSLPLSLSVMCVYAAAKNTLEDLAGLTPGQVMDLRLSDEESLAVLKTRQYHALSAEPTLLLSDGGMLIAARAGHSLDQLAGFTAEGLASLGLGLEDVQVVGTCASYIASSRFEIAGEGMTVEGALVTKTTDPADGGYRCAAGPALGPAGVHWAEFVNESGGELMFCGLILDGWDVAGGINAQAVDGHCFFWTNNGARCPGDHRDWPGIQPANACGDRIGMRLDLGAGSLTVFKNGALLGVMQGAGLEGRAYRWAVSLRNKGYSMRLAAPSAASVAAMEPAALEAAWAAANPAAAARQKPRWVRDAEAAACMCCAEQFGMLMRPHHCRYCGWVVCGGCCGGTAVLQRWLEDKSPHAVVEARSPKPLRVCDGCLAAVGAGGGAAAPAS